MDIFNQLIGSWELRRNIFDHLGRGQLVGQCLFTKIADVTILCQESGVLNYNGYQTEVSRSYIYELRDNKIYILYNDPHRPSGILHELDFTIENQKCIAQHCHDCGQDSYDLRFEYTPNGHMLMNYVVKGPHKNYIMMSKLTKL